MKLIKYFDAFLENTVNLNPARMELLQTRTIAIENFLRQDEVFAPLLKATIPQGSFAQKTIIQPREDGTFDADLLVHLDPMPDWAACEYVGKLYTALGRSPVYKGMRHRRTRCVYIDYADEFHVDLVPYVESNGLGYITNRKTDSFELTDPKRFTGWLKDQHRITGGQLIKVIRLLKYVRDTTYGLNVKSVILTTLVGQRVSAFRATLNPGCYADVPTTLKTVVDDLDDYLQQNYYLPTILDPGGQRRPPRRALGPGGLCRLPHQDPRAARENRRSLSRRRDRCEPDRLAERVRHRVQGTGDYDGRKPRRANQGRRPGASGNRAFHRSGLRDPVRAQRRDGAHGRHRERERSADGVPPARPRQSRREAPRARVRHRGLQRRAAL
jgi:hypothetical protein